MRIEPGKTSSLYYCQMFALFLKKEEKCSYSLRQLVHNFFHARIKKFSSETDKVQITSLLSSYQLII